MRKMKTYMANQIDMYDDERHKPVECVVVVVQLLRSGSIKSLKFWRRRWPPTSTDQQLNNNNYDMTTPPSTHEDDDNSAAADNNHLV